MRLGKLRDSKGFTLIEAMLMIGVVSILGVFVSRWTAQPVRLMNAMEVADRERLRYRGTNTIVNDLKEAQLDSVWSNVYPEGASRTELPWFSKVNYTFNSIIPSKTSVTYRFEPAGAPIGNVVRYFDELDPPSIAHSTRTVVLEGVLAPDAAPAPAFYEKKASEPRSITLTFLFPEDKRTTVITGNNQVRQIVRRVSVRG